MRYSLIRHNSIIRLAALTLVAVCIIQPPVRAYPTAIHTGAAQDSHIDLYRNVWVNPGLAPGQTLRYTWANLNDPDPQKRILEPLRIRVRLLAADGSVIARTEAAAVGAGQFQSFDFNRDQISLPGEYPTGRLQTTLEATVTGQTKYGNIVLKEGILETFDDAVEVIDNSGGRTTVSLSGGVNEVILNDSPGAESLNTASLQIISASKDYLIGIVPGQTLRVNALNPIAPGEDGRKFKMLFAFTILLADGSVVAQSDEVALEPGEFHSFDFKPADLPLISELSGRRQVRARVIWKKLQLETEFPSIVGFPSLVEIIDDSTGKATVLISQKPKEIVVVGSK
jgi:hypothetical protein